jgi:hypothetical protein
VATPFRRLTHLVRRLPRHAHFIKHNDEQTKTRKSPSSQSCPLCGQEHCGPRPSSQLRRRRHRRRCGRARCRCPARTRRRATGAHLQCLYRRTPRPAPLAAGVQDSHRGDGEHRQLLADGLRRAEDAGIEVCLVNARHVKGVPGKKTDVCDAAWLQQLHAAGLLRASFRPRREIIPLRYLMRTEPIWSPRPASRCSSCRR